MLLNIDDVVPNFIAKASNNNDEFIFDTVAGRYIVLTFYGTLQNEYLHKIYQDFIQDMRAFFDDDVAALIR